MKSLTRSLVTMRTNPTMVALAMAALSLLFLPHLAGYLAQQTGMSLGDAVLLVQTLIGGGAAAAIALFPPIAAFIGTLDGLILLIGVAATAAW